MVKYKSWLYYFLAWKKWQCFHQEKKINTNGVSGGCSLWRELCWRDRCPKEKRNWYALVLTEMLQPGVGEGGGGRPPSPKDREACAHLCPVESDVPETPASLCPVLFLFLFFRTHSSLPSLVLGLVSEGWGLPRYVGRVQGSLYLGGEK